MSKCIKRLKVSLVILLMPAFWSITLTAQALGIDSQAATLANGLRVIMVEDHKSPVVTFQIWYRIGAQDEPAGSTGLTHLMEHMMFKGTAKYPKGEFSKTVARAGGTENAFTSKDYTAYFQKWASDRLELSLELESDRMRNLLLDAGEFDLEREVVKEERRSSYEDDPTSAVMEELRAAAFKVHPYRNPAIGWMSHLNTLTVEELRKYYRQMYHPANAIIVMVGDFQPDAVLPKIKHYFENIPAGKPYRRREIIEPPQLGERRVLVHKPAQLPFVALGYHVPNLAHPDSYPLEVLARVLSAGKSSRLYQELVYKRKIALYAGGGYNRVNAAPELFLFYGGLQPGHTASEFEEAIYAEQEKLKNELVSEEELQKAKNQLEASFIFGQDSIFYQAMKIGQLEAMGVDHHYLDEFIPNIRKVTRADLQRVAKAYFTPKNRTVATLVPEEATMPPQTAAPRHH